MAAVLEARIQAKHFGPKQVLAHLQLQIGVGEVVSLVGASGSGKSTLLRIVAGLERTFHGDVLLHGQPLRGRSQDIGFIFQEPRLFPWLTVAQNVAFGATSASQEASARAAQMLAEVGLAGYESALPKELSGGQAQRVAIARGLFTQPRILLLDEPFSAVDAFTRMQLQDLLIRIAQHHRISVLLVTHDVYEAVYLSDRVLVLAANPGTVCEAIAIAAPRPRARTDAPLAIARATVLSALQRVHAIG